MRPRPMLLEFFAHALGDRMHRQSGGIRGDDGARLANLRDARKQLPLDLQILRHNFNDPVRLRTAPQIILEIPNGNAFRQGRCEKCRRLGLLRRLEPRAHDLVPVRCGSIGRQIGRHDIQQNAGQSGIRKMRGNPRAHRSRTQHHCLFNPPCHRYPFENKTGYKTSIAGSNQMPRRPVHALR